MNNIAEKFIEQRFGHSAEYYKQQWRERFENGTEWAYSDLTGRRLLQDLAPNVYPADITKQIGE